MGIKDHLEKVNYVKLDVTLPVCPEIMGSSHLRLKGQCDGDEHWQNTAVAYALNLM